MYGMLCSLSIICGPYACLDNFIMLASSVKDSRSFKHGFIFAGLLHSNSLWHRLFVYGSGIPVMPQDFFSFGHFSVPLLLLLHHWRAG